MPYIITTRSPVRSPRFVGDRSGDGHSVRRAVPTLDEHNLWRTLYGVDVETVDAILAFPEAGGTIGPLPDGTVIEVAPVEWQALVDALPSGQRAALFVRYPTVGGHHIIDAYNAREAAPAR